MNIATNSVLMPESFALLGGHLHSSKDSHLVWTSECHCRWSITLEQFTRLPCVIKWHWTVWIQTTDEHLFSVGDTTTH